MSGTLSEAAVDVLDSLRSLLSGGIPDLMEDTGRSRGETSRALVELEEAGLAQLIGRAWVPLDAPAADAEQQGSSPGPAEEGIAPSPRVHGASSVEQEDPELRSSAAAEVVTGGEVETFAAPSDSPDGPGVPSVAVQPAEHQPGGATSAPANWKGRGGWRRGAPRRDQAATYVREHPGCAVADVATGLGVSKVAAAHALSNALDAGLVARSGERDPRTAAAGPQYRWWPLAGAAQVRPAPVVPGPPRGSRRDQVVAAVRRHPEGISLRDLAAELDQSYGAVKAAAQKACVAGLIRRTGQTSLARYWPVVGEGAAEAGADHAGVTGDDAPSASSWAADLEAEVEEARRALEEDCDDEGGCEHAHIVPLPRDERGGVDGRCADCGATGFPLEIQGPSDPEDPSREAEALRRVALVERLLLARLPEHVRDESFEVRVAFLAGRMA